MIEKGRANTIHFKKDISIWYSFSKRPIRIEFGGVPITVAIPPAFAEKAIPKSTLTAKFRSFLVKPSTSSIKSLITDMAMGSITTTVAVLLIHILKEAVAIIKPSTTLFGVVPVIRIMLSAILLWRFTFSKASAITKPPKNKKIIGLP